jgi:hypothetical protein
VLGADSLEGLEKHLEELEGKAVGRLQQQVHPLSPSLHSEVSRFKGIEESGRRSRGWGPELGADVFFLFLPLF